MEPPNIGHFGDDINSSDLFFLDVVLFGGSKCIVEIIMGPQCHVMSFVERFIILCPYMGESTIRGSTIVLPLTSIVLTCTVQCSTVQYSTVQYSTVQYSTVQYSAVQYSTVQYSVVQYSTVQYSAVQCSAVQ